MGETNTLKDIISFWETSGSDIANGAVVLSAIIAFIIISVTKRTAKKRATIDLLSRSEENLDLEKTRDEFIKLKKAGGLEKWATEENKEHESTQIIRKVLNSYELIAVAIREGIIDEGLYRRWYYTTIINDWKATEGYIKALRNRTNTDTFFCEFWHLAERWTDGGFKDKKPLRNYINRLKKRYIIPVVIIAFILGAIIF